MPQKRGPGRIVCCKGQCTSCTSIGGNALRNALEWIRTTGRPDRASRPHPSRLHTRLLETLPKATEITKAPADPLHEKREMQEDVKHEMTQEVEIDFTKCGKAKTKEMNAIHTYPLDTGRYQFSMFSQTSSF